VFDPYNIVLLRAYNHLNCSVFIRSDDFSQIHHIPNLLRLKRDLRVTFFLYDTVSSVTNGDVKVIFPRGGLAIMDSGTLISCPSGM